MLAPALLPFVASMTAYDLEMPGPGVHRGLPSTTLTLVLPIGEPLDLAWAEDPTSRRQGWSIVAGLHTVPVQVHYGHRQVGLQLQLTARGSRALIGLPVLPWLANCASSVISRPTCPPRWRTCPRMSPWLARAPPGRHWSTGVWRRRSPSPGQRVPERMSDTRWPGSLGVCRSPPSRRRRAAPGATSGP